VKNEGLDWLADIPLYTKRFAYYVGRRCRETTVRELAEELLLDWHTVKELDKQYMREQLRRVGIKSTWAIGIDEISVGRGHDYRIVVSDLIRGRPIWFGGEDRSEKSLDGFFVWFGPENCRRIRIAVMDMWKPFRKSTLKKGNAPQAMIVYDKFHVLRHLGEAMDEVRRAEYARLEGRERRLSFHQRAKVQSAVSLGEPRTPRQEGFEGAIQSEPPPSHRLPSPGFVRAVVELRSCGLGTAFLRPMV
jgi:transposase